MPEFVRLIIVSGFVAGIIALVWWLVKKSRQEPEPVSLSADWKTIAQTNSEKIKRLRDNLRHHEVRIAELERELADDSIFHKNHVKILQEIYDPSRSIKKLCYITFPTEGHLHSCPLRHEYYAIIKEVPVTREHETFSDIIFEFGHTRGDLSEQYARDQMLERIFAVVKRDYVRKFEDPTLYKSPNAIRQEINEERKKALRRAEIEDDIQFQQWVRNHTRFGQEQQKTAVELDFEFFNTTLQSHYNGPFGKMEAIRNYKPLGDHRGINHLAACADTYMTDSEPTVLRCKHGYQWIPNFNINHPSANYLRSEPKPEALLAELRAIETSSTGVFYHLQHCHLARVDGDTIKCDHDMAARKKPIGDWIGFQGV